ncbi:transmembrane protein 26-like [Cololabis saira]|uniref:transmembrane protein 26-like n=1 Tax=Cololabis saira TaxID=129043 RepID=UPI002AD465F9|nr:transmembrane protein 26-like [Cololabis saira]
MGLVQFLCAFITRSFFVLVAMIGVFRVAEVKKDTKYWLLTLLFLPLVVEMIITLKRRKGKDYKWVSPPIFLFLLSIIPSIWILELDHRQPKDSNSECKKLDSWDNVINAVTLHNRTMQNQTLVENLKALNNMVSSICSNTWILALHQIVLILLILGKWLLPLGGGITRNELSQLLLIFVGTAADILEFTSETLSDIKNDSLQPVYIILSVWTWSMLQFPLHLSVVNSKSDTSEGGEGVQEESLLSKHSTDIWSIVETLFIQDGPFLVVRVTVLTYYKVFHQMLVFFTLKNFLVVLLNFYRLAVICQDYRSPDRSSGSAITDL